MPVLGPEDLPTRGRRALFWTHSQNPGIGLPLTAGLRHAKRRAFSRAGRPIGQWEVVARPCGRNPDPPQRKATRECEVAANPMPPRRTTLGKPADRPFE